MLKAYHQVRQPGDVEAILETGAILPLINFIDPSQVRASCADFLRAFRSRHRQEPKMVPAAAFSAIVDEAVEAIRERQQQGGIRPPGLPWKATGWTGEAGEVPATNLQCEDILAGDLIFVFLSPGYWTNDWRPSGFGFDAEELVRQGVGVRPVDFLSHYIKHIESVLMKDWRSQEEAKTAIERGLARIVRDEQIHGAEALAELRRFEKQDAARLRATGPELVSVGALPVDLAVEVWKNGWKREIR